MRINPERLTHCPNKQQTFMQYTYLETQPVVEAVVEVSLHLGHGHFVVGTFGA